MEKKKKDSIFRKGALVPFIIVSGSIIAVTILFLDMGLKSGLEFGLSKAIGAKVQVRDVNTSFSDLSLRISAIQIPNTENLEENIINIGTIYGKLSWDALLRAKLLIPILEVSNIKVYEKRQSAAVLLPKDEQENKKVKEIKNQVLGSAKKENQGNFIGDLADAAGDGNLGDVSLDNLGSQQKINKTQAQIEAQKEKLDTLIKDLPTNKEINKLQDEIQNFPFKDLGNLAKAAGTLKDLDKLKKKVDNTLKKYQKVEKEVNKTIKITRNMNINVKELVAADLEELKKQANIPSMDTDALARTIFGDSFADNIQKAKKYYGYIEEYLPPKKDKEKPTYSKNPRAVGRNYQFGTPNSYPLFWIKEVKFLTSKGESFEIDGKITDITSNQRIVGKTTLGDIKFSDKVKGIKGGLLAFDIDHKDKPKAAMKFYVDSLLVNNKVIVNSPDAKFKMKEASLNTRTSVIIKKKIFDIKSKNEFSKITYDNEAKSKEVLALLNGVSEVSPELKIKANALGKLDDLKVEIDSNLASAFNKSLNLMFQKKIDALKSKYKEQIEDRISSQKKQLDQEIAKAKSGADKALADANKEIDKIKSQVKKEEKKAKKGAEKNLLKGIKF